MHFPVGATTCMRCGVNQAVPYQRRNAAADGWLAAVPAGLQFCRGYQWRQSTDAIP